MAGASEVSNLKGSFAAVGDFELEEQERLDEQDKETETNSLANSSVYGRLNEPEDVQSFYNFYNQTKKEREPESKDVKPF